MTQGLSASEKEDVYLPINKGLIGHTATSKEPLNIRDVTQDPRFDPNVDESASYKINSLLCMPVLSQDGQVIAVIRVLLLALVLGVSGGLGRWVGRRGGGLRPLMWCLHTSE
jgi:signal transduction protein with GAF and PtsI domain